MDGYKLICKQKRNFDVEKNKLLNKYYIVNSDDYFNIIYNIEKKIWEKNKKRLIEGKMLDVLWKEVSSFSNYEEDLIISIYMYQGISKAKAISLSGEVEKTNDMINESTEIDLIEKKLTDEEKKERKKIQYEDIRKFFPFEIKKYNGFSYITAWCSEYQQQLWNQNNKNILLLDAKMKSEDITKYGYIKMETMYQKLKEKEIENLLIFEMTLGFEMTNVIYRYLDNFKELKEMQNLQPIIEMLCKIPGINMRKRISQFVFYSLREVQFHPIKIKETIKILEEIVKEIENNYNKYLTIYSMYFIEKEKEVKENEFNYVEYMYKMREQIIEGQSKFWNDYREFDFPNIVNKKFYEDLGILKLREIYDIIPRCEEMLIEIYKEIHKIGVAIEENGDPRILNLKKRLGLGVKTQFERDIEFREEDIIRGGESQDNRNDPYSNYIGIIKKELELIFKNEKNSRIKISTKIEVEKRYAVLEKIISYHLLKKMSSKGKIPVNI